MNIKKHYLKKKNIIKIPKNIKIFYCDSNKIITFLGLLQKKSLKLKIKILLLKSKNFLIITNFPISLNIKKTKNLKILQGTTIAKIKQILIEISYTLYSKLKFIGLGYRALNIESIENQIYLKLGYSHLIYFRIPSPFKILCIRFTKLYIFGISSYELLSKISALLRSCKFPEPYKGKGILYFNEKIILKKGKKI